VSEFKIICRHVQNQEELLGSYSLRKEVFVEEQKLFKRTDRDRHDKHAIHIIALYNNKIVGTVRVHRDKSDIWFGSRLAVLKRFRGKAGKILIQKAVEVVKVNGAKQFMAHIQKRNVPLFKRLKWKPVGQIITYHHEPHQLMEAKLD
jgi:putative N-acetyltransferase (TIGR04045 family)